MKTKIIIPIILLIIASIGIKLYALDMQVPDPNVVQTQEYVTISISLNNFCSNWLEETEEETMQTNNVEGWFTNKLGQFVLFDHWTLDNDANIYVQTTTYIQNDENDDGWLNEQDDSYAGQGQVSGINNWFRIETGQIKIYQHTIEPIGEIKVVEKLLPMGDANNDGIVNLIDFAIIANTWKNDTNDPNDI